MPALKGYCRSLYKKLSRIDSLKICELYNLYNIGTTLVNVSKSGLDPMGVSLFGTSGRLRATEPHL